MIYFDKDYMHASTCTQKKKRQKYQQFASSGKLKTGFTSEYHKKYMKIVIFDNFNENTTLLANFYV